MLLFLIELSAVFGAYVFEIFNLTKLCDGLGAGGDNVPFPHLSMWLVTGRSSTHWHDFFLESHVECAKPHSLSDSHLSPNFRVPRCGSEKVLNDNCF